MQIKDSMECAKSELDLFSVPPTNTAFEEGHWGIGLILAQSAQFYFLIADLYLKFKSVHIFYTFLHP